MRKLLFLPLLLMLSLSATSPNETTDDKQVVKALFDEVLSNGECYENLRVLCKDIGGRLSGSEEADRAVIWGKELMESYGFDKVWLQEVTVPVWERGAAEQCNYVITNQPASGKSAPLNVCALGGSVATDGEITGELIEFKTLDDLKAADPATVQGKIVLLNQPMDPKLYDTFHAYGGCYPIRASGASEGSRKGAIAVLIRSLGLRDDDFPHTGTMHYDDGVDPIPAGAMSTNDCNRMSEYLAQGKTVQLSLTMNCRSLPDKKSHNVIGEITGSEHPEKIILVGGHLDAWDNGEGAHDDGAGVVHSVEVLRLLQKTGVKPRHTIRAVLFMNEENGNRGGQTYAAQAKEKGEMHVAAIESDRGGFSPRGFSIDAKSENIVPKVASWEPALKDYGLYFFEKGYGGVDIGPLKNVQPDVVLMGLVPDSQRYFDHHHSPNDVFEAVNKRELELGAGSMAAMVYLIDKYGF